MHEKNTMQNKRLFMDFLLLSAIASACSLDSDRPADRLAASIWKALQEDNPNIIDLQARAEAVACAEPTRCRILLAMEMAKMASLPSCMI